jgi:hypothetical protein
LKNPVSIGKHLRVTGDKNPEKLKTKPMRVPFGQELALIACEFLRLQEVLDDDR